MPPAVHNRQNLSAQPIRWVFNDVNDEIGYSNNSIGADNVKHMPVACGVHSVDIVTVCLTDH